jgi:hypothetical protein
VQEYLRRWAKIYKPEWLGEELKRTLCQEVCFAKASAFAAMEVHDGINTT